MEEWINLIIRKWPRANFNVVANDFIEFTIAGHRYNLNAYGSALECNQSEDCEFSDTAFSRWVTGVLAGRSRNDSGELTDA